MSIRTLLSGRRTAKSQSSDVFRWIAINQLAIGTAPRDDSFLLRLSKESVTAILNLCSPSEYSAAPLAHSLFVYKQYPLPDHRSHRSMTVEDLHISMSIIEGLHREGHQVFVHCLASMERSPVICLAWLARRKSLTLTQALDYLMQVHPSTNPLPSQLDVVRDYLSRL